MRSMTQQAFAEAIDLSHGWVGAEHLLLALLSDESVATDVLVERGITYARVAALLRRGGGESAAGLSGPTPDGQEVRGRAQGLALAAGFRAPLAEHWLLALLYSPPGMRFPSLLGVLGVAPEDLREGLRRRGVRVPDLELPPRAR